MGNLALGGRAKTPFVAALTRALQRRGLRPAILLRGYPRVARSAAPVLLHRERADLDAPWLVPLVRAGCAAPAWTHALVAGDEAAWLAAVTGVPVVAHPDRVAASGAVLAAHPVDVLVLDDGLQTPVRTDLAVVLVDPDRDLLGSRAPVATRESVTSLPPDTRWVHLGADIRREPAALRTLTGALVEGDPGAVSVCAGVGDPESVAACARAAGLTVRGTLRVRDHGRPSSRQLRGAGRLLVTEKDAVGWAAALAPADTLVLGLRLAGADTQADALAAALANVPAQTPASRTQSGGTD